VLWGIAERLIPESPGIAIVVAHMACEVATEGALSRACASGGVPDLEDVALTRDKVHEQPFWLRFRESAKLRNRIMHGEQTATAAEAERSLAAAKGFLAHVRRVCA
jgi:hypothetical protein